MCCGQAVKFGYLFGVHRKSLDYEMPSKNSFRKAADLFEKTFAKCVKETKKVGRREENLFCAALMSPCAYISDFALISSRAA